MGFFDFINDKIPRVRKSGNATRVPATKTIQLRTVPHAADPKQPGATGGEPKEAYAGVTSKDGFYFFQDEYSLPKEPSVENAVEKYLPFVERAFENKFALHPNLISERTTSQQLAHAYDLDYRDGEMRRIREILPADAEVFDYIDALVDIIMLQNLRIYLQERTNAFNRIARRSRAFMVLFSLLVFAPLLFLVWALSLGRVEAFLVAATASAIFGLVASNMAANRSWHNMIELKLSNTKEKYEEAVRDAAGLAAAKLAAKARDIESLMRELKNKLDTISSPNDARVKLAPKLWLWHFSYQPKICQHFRTSSCRTKSERRMMPLSGPGSYTRCSHARLASSRQLLLHLGARSGRLSFWVLQFSPLQWPGSGQLFSGAGTSTKNTNRNLHLTFWKLSGRKWMPANGQDTVT